MDPNALNKTLLSYFNTERFLPVRLIKNEPELAPFEEAEPGCITVHLRSLLISGLLEIRGNSFGAAYRITNAGKATLEALEREVA